jgi:hypothetical protein
MAKNDLEIEETKEDNKKIEKIRNLYIWKDIFIISEWRLEKIDYKELKKDDYIIKYDQEREFYIVDRDKRKLRPYIEDLLRQMNIETLMTKLMRVSIIIVFLCLIFTIFSLVIWLNLKSKVEEMMIKIEDQNKKPINIWSGILLNNL